VSEIALGEPVHGPAIASRIFLLGQAPGPHEAKPTALPARSASHVAASSPWRAMRRFHAIASLVPA